MLQDRDGLTLFEHSLPTSESTYPDLAVVFPAANRMQRAAFDLVGIASESEDQRPWTWQASWPIDVFPLRRDFEASPKWQPGEEEYAFVRVEGDGVHEIPVGPVHAGIIEPGHFRFQVVGEKVLRLEERLGFVHKGIEKRFESMPAASGHRLAGRVSGDSTVAYAWAYAQALEAIAGSAPPPRALMLRALALERERIANHLGDLGYLGNDGGFAFGLAQFSRLKEDVLRTNLAIFGHRLAMDYVVPGGVAQDLTPASAAALRDECATLDREIRILKDIYDEHDGLQDRFRTCGVVTPALAAKLGLTGLAGRASGQARDLRCDFPGAPYDALAVRKMSSATGDVAARVAVRFDELFESLRIVLAIVDAIPQGDIVAPVADASRVSQRAGLHRRLARTRADRARMRPRRNDPPLPSARSVVGELAGARARGHRQHRSRLSADQQIVQPVVQRPGSLAPASPIERHAMLHILRQIARTGIKTEPPPAPDSERVIVERLQAGILKTLGRALAIRQVDAGSCNGCELEIHALANPYYNIEGLGIRFVASPRHADMLLVTGPVSKHMAIALTRTYDATPDPKLVVAVGDCGCTGGIFGESYASLGRVANVIPVDVEIPGCPPTPTALLSGILAAITAQPQEPPIG